MGGFAVNIEYIHNKLKRATLTKNALILLAEEGHFMTEIPESIADKSKANLLAKGLTCLQVLWAAGQAIERRATGFPIALLEYHTLVHCFCAFVMYVLWAQKPYDIQDPTIVPTDNFPDLLAFIVGSSTWSGNSGFVSRTTDSKPETIQSKFHPSQDPPIFWFGNLEENENSEESKPIPCHPSPNDSPLNILDPKIRNWSLRVKEASEEEIHPNFAGNNGLQDLQLPPTYYSVYPVKRVFAPVRNIEPVLFLESGQALRCGLGVWSLTTNFNQNGVQKCHMQGYRLGLSQMDVLRLDLAGNFIRKHVEDPEGNPKIRNSFLEMSHDGKEPARTIRYFSGIDSTPYGQLIDCRVHNWIGLDELSAILNGGSCSAILIAMILIPGAYGGIHLVAAIHEMFPSEIEYILWKSSCIVLLGSAAVCLLVLAIQFLLWPCLMYRHRKLFHEEFARYEFWNSLRPRIVALAKKTRVAGIAIIGPVYVAARIFLVTESFISLRHVPIGVYQTPDVNLSTMFHIYSCS
jgi:hypothetical protein